MKPLIIFFAFLTATAYANSFVNEKNRYDEGTLFAPPFNNSGVDRQLTDLMDSKGNSQLCAPVAISHAFEFLKKYRSPAFPLLPTVHDVDGDGVADTFKDRIRYFFQTCNTDKEVGTRYSQATNCMDAFIKLSTYQSWTYMIGPHSHRSPPGHPPESTRHVLRLSDLKYYVGNQAAVLMGIGWYQFNNASQMWERSGGHFINIYGYANMANWGEDQADLFVVNSWIDYRGRATNQQFDTIKMSSTKYLKQGTVPGEIAFELTGEGFNFGGTKAFVEDIFVAYPYTQ